MAPSHDDDHQEEETPAPAGHDQEEEETPPPASSRYRPAGYHFAPTDCELIRKYLQKKVKNENFPLSDQIKETSQRLKSPEALAAELPPVEENTWYLFKPRGERAADSGYWKAAGMYSMVLCEEGAIGFKQTLVFYQGKSPKGERTQWRMHEYSLDDDDIHWVLCRLFYKTNNATPAFASASECICDSTQH